ncbi:DUF5320 domain-containing protein [Planctomycetota bacterium]
MPGRDGTGPMGFGPMTGRSAGDCAGYASPGFVNSVPGGGRFGMGRGLGRGRGAGFGRGRGFRAGFVPNAQPVAPFQMDPASESKMLVAEIGGLKDELKAMEDRLETLKESDK